MFQGIPCTPEGDPLPPGTPPSPPTINPADYSPFQDRFDFQIAQFLFKKVQMSGKNIDELMYLWAAQSLKNDGTAPFTSHKELYALIDAIPFGDAPWQSFSVKYDGELPEGTPPSWMLAEYEVWFRDPAVVLKNMLENSDFSGEFDYSAFREYDEKGERKWKDFMSGNWSWRQSVSFCWDSHSLFLLIPSLTRTKS